MVSPEYLVRYISSIDLLACWKRAELPVLENGSIVACCLGVPVCILCMVGLLRVIDLL